MASATKHTWKVRDRKLEKTARKRTRRVQKKLAKIRAESPIGI